MTSKIALFLAASCSLAVYGCGNKADGGTKSSSTTEAPASAQPNGSSTTAGSSTPANGKLVHVKRAQDECTFDFDVPEEMKEAAKDGMSFTLESESFSFVGFAGTTLNREPKHVFDMMQDKDNYKDLYRGTDTGTVLAIMTHKEPPPADAKDKHAISGMGTEPYAEGRSTGCTFNCTGVASRQAEAVALCKSVKITVDKSKIPE
ncbi:MAG: hypothetical protein HOW73_19260 [Polyangiaceae bacterium]|nr:hypothetical protein [Polyangiaceae bacterium]